MSDNKLANKIVNRLGQLKTARKPHEKVWKECFDYSFPIRGVGIDGTVSNTDDVQRKKLQLFDSTLTDAAKTQASAIISGLNGQTVRYIECFKEGVYSHCSALFQFEDGTQTLTGLDYLEGCTIDVVADDVVMQQRTVVKNGTITLERKAKKIVVGLLYSTEIELLPIEIQGGLAQWLFHRG